MPRTGRTERASPARSRFFVGLSVFLFFLLPGVAVAQESATLVWRGATHPIAYSATAGFSVPDALRALGLTASRDADTGTLTITGQGRSILIGPGTRDVPVGDRMVPLSKPASEIRGALYAPADFFEKVLFPLVGAAASWDSEQRTWTLLDPTPAPLSLQVAVVHVAPTTQVVLRLSAPARFVPRVIETGFQVRFPAQRLTPPFPERRYEDPLVSAVRFSGDSAFIDFREPGLTARAYPLTNPDRIVIEVGREAPIVPASAATPVPPPPQPITIVIDPGHGGGETGAIGPGGLQEKEVTLQLSRRLAATIPRLLASRVVLTRDSDSALPLDDRTAVANHEKADLFLSIHANSSKASGANGSETYYLSLEASDRLSQEVARRENQVNGTAATPSSAVSPDLDFILWDLAQSAHLRESSELAEAIQEELNIVSRTENRGIKQ
ncbi:MAG: N-acetylmuramoyl-L-alanine amidase, partial [Thermoanaerobaculia bacterium]|nr:N-acetylmuramoyl-L-alanine amidase [Thermoanaerobaculia bacterium]